MRLGRWLRPAGAAVVGLVSGDGVAVEVIRMLSRLPGVARRSRRESPAWSLTWRRAAQRG